tara:strand:+ start:498 stop:647 length:150 start_codon:yes stop_codon:yes gene_type:complete
MNIKNFTKQYNSLCSELYNHPHKLEILNIMQEQLMDDNPVIAREHIKAA